MYTIVLVLFLVKKSIFWYDQLLLEYNLEITYAMKGICFDQLRFLIGEHVVEFHYFNSGFL